MSDLLNPPAIPAAILNFFSTQPDFAALAGDLSEEFHRRAQSAGAAAAKRWYWREAFRNAMALTAREVLRTPLRTTAVAVAAYLAINLATGLYFVVRYFPRSLDLLASRFQFWDPMELVRDPVDRSALLVLQFAASFLLGWFGARLLPGREWALTLGFTWLAAAIAAAASWYLFVALGVTLLADLRDFMFTGLALRLAGFCLGALWSRRTLPAAPTEPIR